MSLLAKIVDTVGAASPVTVAPPPADPPQAAPCPRCCSQVFYRGPYPPVRCAGCEPPRDFRFVREVLVLVRTSPNEPWRLEQLPAGGSYSARGGHAGHGAEAGDHQAIPQGVSGGRRFTISGEGPVLDGVWLERIEPRKDSKGVRVLERCS